MAERFFSEADLDKMHDAGGVMEPLAYTLRAPMPQMLLVARDPSAGDGGAGVVVRTVTLSPISWIPYTKVVAVDLEDEKVVRSLHVGGECVLGLPSRDLLRELTICAQRLPRGISEADVARLPMLKSLYVDVPGIETCPVNYECVVDHLEEYHGHLVAFLRVVGASIDDALLFLEREEIVSRFPTNLADEVVDEEGVVRSRVSLLGDLMLCPTFPVAPKRGWYATFDIWMRDLAEEGYLSPEEHEQVAGWNARWEAVFADLDAPERAQLRDKLTHVIRLISRQRWADLHVFLEHEGEA